jgi:hypothetical protein
VASAPQGLLRPWLVEVSALSAIENSRTATEQLVKFAATLEPCAVLLFFLAVGADDAAPLQAGAFVQDCTAPGTIRSERLFV